MSQPHWGDQTASGHTDQLVAEVARELASPETWRAAPTGGWLGVGLVGAGLIARSGHVPAYQQAGIPIIGLYDRDTGRAAALAAECGARVYPTVDALLADPRVQVVDLAIPTPAQPALIRQVIGAGKSLLCQKPLAETLGEARALVPEARRRGVHLAVNQNGRWEPAIRGLSALLRRGVLGQPRFVTIARLGTIRWELWPWLHNAERLLLLYDTIHFLDFLRFLFGDPAWIFCSTTQDDRSALVGETAAVATLGWADGLLGTLSNRGLPWPYDERATIELEGTEGVARATLGVFYDYPTGRPDTLAFCRREISGSWHDIPLTGRWIPDAFAGPMAALQRAIVTSSTAENSGEDNLRTLALVEAAYRSAREHQAIVVSACLMRAD